MCISFFIAYTNNNYKINSLKYKIFTNILSDYSSKIRNLLFENKIDTEDQNIDIINESQLLLNHTKKFAF